MKHVENGSKDAYPCQISPSLLMTALVGRHMPKEASSKVTHPLLFLLSLFFFTKNMRYKHKLESNPFCHYQFVFFSPIRNMRYKYKIKLNHFSMLDVSGRNMFENALYTCLTYEHVCAFFFIYIKLHPKYHIENPNLSSNQ